MNTATVETTPFRAAETPFTMKMAHGHALRNRHELRGHWTVRDGIRTLVRTCCEVAA